MTLDEKVHRYLSETREQGVGGWTAAPPLIRLLWLLSLDVPPPFYWSFAAVAVLSGCFFAFFVFCMQAGRRCRNRRRFLWLGDGVVYAAKVAPSAAVTMGRPRGGRCITRRCTGPRPRSVTVVRMVVGAAAASEGPYVRRTVT
jgi:hypothetical protein